MNIVIGSAFRNASYYIVRYLNQVLELRANLGPSNPVRVIAAEGDSKDQTRLILGRRYSIDIQVVDASHGERVFKSTEEPDRLAALSKVGNTIFDAVKPSDDVLIYVESDLIWDAPTMLQLINLALAREGGFDIFAPLVMAGKAFYDIWGFRALNGERFVPFFPFHLGLEGNTLMEVGSVGSCLVMRGEVARQCRIRNDYALVGWCEDARANGHRIAVHSGLWVNHP